MMGIVSRRHTKSNEVVNPLSVECDVRADPSERWGGGGGAAPGDRSLPQTPSTWTTLQRLRTKGRPR